MKAVLIVLLLVVVAGCTHSTINKECKPVSDSDKYVCRSILPWQ